MAALDSVRSARVHLAIAKESPFLRKGDAPAASVMLNIYPGRILSDRQLAGIVHLVSSSVPNLDSSQVSVVDQAGKLLSDQGEDEAMGSSKEHYRLTQQLVPKPDFWDDNSLWIADSMWYEDLDNNDIWNKDYFDYAEQPIVPNHDYLRKIN